MEFLNTAVPRNLRREDISVAVIWYLHCSVMNNDWTIVETWNVHESIKLDLHLSAQLFLHKDRPEQLHLYCSWDPYSSSHLLLHLAINCEYVSWTQPRNIFTVFQLRTMASDLQELTFILAASHSGVDRSSALWGLWFKPRNSRILSANSKKMRL